MTELDICHKTHLDLSVRIETKGQAEMKADIGYKMLLKLQRGRTVLRPLRRDRCTNGWMDRWMDKASDEETK